MFKIISSKKFKRMQSLIDEQTEKLEEYEKDLYNYSNQIKDLQGLKDIQNKRIADLENSYEMTKATNHNLTDWIQKVLKDVGVYNVSNGNPVSIPIYRKEAEPVFNTDKMNNDYLKREEIIVPEIRFIKIG